MPSIISKKYLKLFFPEQIIHNRIMENKLAFEPDEPKNNPAIKQISNPKIFGLQTGTKHAKKKRLRKEKKIFPPIACANSLKLISSIIADTPKPIKTLIKFSIEYFFGVLIYPFMVREKHKEN